MKEDHSRVSLTAAKSTNRRRARKNSLNGHAAESKLRAKFKGKKSKKIKGLPYLDLMDLKNEQPDHEKWRKKSVANDHDKFSSNFDQSQFYQTTNSFMTRLEGN